LQHRDKTDPMASNQRTEFIKVKNDFPDLLVKRLTRKEIEDWLRVLRTHSMGKYKSGIVKGPYKEASVRRFFFSLKRAIDWHKHARGYHVPDDLFKLEKAMKPKAWNGHRERRLRDGEEEALYAAGLTRKLSHSRADWEALIGFALETAMREQEIVFAQFEHVQKGGFDLKIPSENSKTDTRRIVHLSVKAQSIIAAQKLTCPPGETRIFHQFPSPKAVCVAFIALCARAKVVDFHFHDLRHEAAYFSDRGRLSRRDRGRRFSLIVDGQRGCA
jgi:integrase